MQHLPTYFKRSEYLVGQYIKAVPVHLQKTPKKQKNKQRNPPKNEKQRNKQKLAHTEAGTQKMPHVSNESLLPRAFGHNAFHSLPKFILNSVTPLAFSSVVQATIFLFLQTHTNTHHTNIQSQCLCFWNLYLKQVLGVLQSYHLHYLDRTPRTQCLVGKPSRKKMLY